MSIKRGFSTSATLTLVFALVGCGGAARETQERGETEDGQLALPPARTLPLPAAPERTAPDNGARGGALGWNAPPTWKAEQPASRMRLAQYSVEDAAGRGECIVYYFGPGQGGDPLANAERWAGQFTQPDGGDSRERMSVSRLEGTAVPVHLVELTGTYDGGMTMTDAPAESHQGYMLLGAVAEGPDAPWFIKFTGPEATVRAQREAFLTMLRSLRLAER